MRSLASTLVLLGLLACGGGGASPDAGPKADAPGAADASPDALPAGCTYAEQRDLTNDDVAPATGTPEDTGLTLATREVICGTFDATHFDGDITVDIDSYTFTVAAATDVLVRISGAGAEAIELVGVDVYTGPTLTDRVGGNTFYGDHGVVALHLAPGTYELAAFALASAAIASAVPYRLEVVSDDPAMRCPALTSGGYAEANDGAANDGNDVVTIPSGAPPALTTATTDAPEPTGLTLAPDTDVRLSGTAADVATADQYEDKDTYAVATDAATNELAVHLTWTVATADLDVLLFEADQPVPVARAIVAATAGPEEATFPVKPGTAYWVMVGAKASSTGLPTSYDLALCPTAFAP